MMSMSTLGLLYRPVGTTFVVFYNLDNTCTTKSFEHLGGIMLTAALSKIQGMAKELSHIEWKNHQVLFATSDQLKRLIILAFHG